jgi:hypothetical protein
MKLTKKTTKRISIISAAAAVIFFIFALIFYLTSPTLDYMIVIALAIGVTPPAIASILHNRWKLKIEKATPDFLRDLATASRTGIPLQVALEHASHRVYGPLTYELQLLVAHMSWGMNFNEALDEFSARIDLPLIKKATVLINEAARHGGDLSDIFDSTAKYLDSINSWSAKRRQQTHVPIYHNYYLKHDVHTSKPKWSRKCFLYQTYNNTSSIKTALSSRLFDRSNLWWVNCWKNQRRLILQWTKTRNSVSSCLRNRILPVPQLNETI